MKSINNRNTKYSNKLTSSTSLGILFFLSVSSSSSVFAEQQSAKRVNPSSQNTTVYHSYTPINLPGLDLGWGVEEPIGYAFLKQILERSERFLPALPPRVVVELRPEPSWVAPNKWSWDVQTSDSDIANQLTTKWYGQASCPDDLTSLQISGPGGQMNQSPLVNPVYGYFDYQSASVDRVKDICVQWAQNNNCDPLEPGCEIQTTFNLFEDVEPQPSDYIQISGSCASGPLPTSHYLPEIELRCLR